VGFVQDLKITFKSTKLDLEQRKNVFGGNKSSKKQEQFSQRLPLNLTNSGNKRN